MAINSIDQGVSWVWEILPWPDTSFKSYQVTYQQTCMQDEHSGCQVICGGDSDDAMLPNEASAYSCVVLACSSVWLVIRGVPCALFFHSSLAKTPTAVSSVRVRGDDTTKSTCSLSGRPLICLCSASACAMWKIWRDYRAEVTVCKQSDKTTCCHP